MSLEDKESRKIEQKLEELKRQVRHHDSLLMYYCSRWCMYPPNHEQNNDFIFAKLVMSPGLLVGGRKEASGA